MEYGDGVKPPGDYIEKVALATGEVIEGSEGVIEPEQLLVQSHRDYHVMDVYARHMMARMIKRTGNEEFARQAMKEARKFGHRIAERIADRFKIDDADQLKQKMFGLKDREYFFRYKGSGHGATSVQEAVEALRADAVAAHERAGGKVRVLLTGGTGFVGKEIMWQVYDDDAIETVYVLIRPKTIRDRKTKEVVKVLSPSDRGEMLLDQLWIEGKARDKFVFLAGDIEKERFGISNEAFERLSKEATHVIHCAASVSFDAPYDESFRANVLGSLNALALSLSLQNTEGSPFVLHVSVETSYIHGRQTKDAALEDEVVFPRNFYNNYYELTKAMASIETERTMLDDGLRVVQLCPAIVIGESRAGNNRGDLKVVNAPVNAFGRAKEALDDNDANWAERSKGKVIARMACVFPGDASAELNLVPVDRVAQGIVAALKQPGCVGERVHLATDNRISAERIRDIVREEIGADVKLAEPTLHRAATLPVLTKLLTGFKQPKLANALEKLGTIFGGYSEWGQPVHAVGNDVSVLGLSDERPVTEHAFRMLCRHNAYVQEFGKIRDLDEISRRERIWWDLIGGLESTTGHPAGALPAEAFHEHVRSSLDLETFTRA